MRSPFQFVLDFFESEPASSESLASPPQPETVLNPVRFAHPQANRTVVFEGVQIAYAFARAKRKTIGFSIGPDGLVVRAPQWVSLKEVEAALQQKSSWVLRKLSESQERYHQLEHTRVAWHDGAQFAYLGKPVQLCIDPAQGSAQLIIGDTNVLRIGVSATANTAQIRDCVQAWLLRQARELFEARLNHFAPLLGVEWKKLSLSNAGTRWGSARVDGAIRLNWRLIHLSPSEIDYVVAHELSHLRVMNHSAQFWETVRSVMPDYAQRRQRLKTESLAAW